MKTFSRACFLVAAALLASSCASNPGKITGRDGDQHSAYDAVMHIAEASRGAGDLNSAIGLYRKASKLAPDRTEPLLALARVLLDLRQTNDAIATYQSALKVSKDDSDALRGLANAYLAAGRADLAGEPLRAALKHNPGDSKLLGTLGVAADLAGDHTAAQGYYRSALAADPADGGVANNLALSLALTGDFATAISILKPVADAPGTTARERQTLSLIYGLSGNREIAARYARMDLDEAATAQNLAYFDTLRGLPSDARANALTAATSILPHQAAGTDARN